MNQKAYFLIFSLFVFYCHGYAAVPASPAQLRAWPISESGIQLSWQDTAADELSYEVFRRDGREGDWVLLVDGLQPNTSMYLDEGLVAGEFYQYRVSARNQDGAASSGLAQAITDDKAFGMRSLSFVQGLGNYEGAVDVGIREDQPTESFKTSYVWVDNNGSNGDNQALLDFSGIIGEEPDRLPPGASLSRAILRIYLGTNSNAQSYKTVSFHQMLVPWGINTSWNAAELGGDGVQIDDVEAKAIYDDINTFGKTDYTYELDVTPAVMAWLNGEAQHGWLIRTGWSDGYAYYMTHNTVPERRPELVVTFDTDPDNMAPVVGEVFEPMDGSTGVHEPALPMVEITDANGDPMDVTLYGRKAPTTDEEPFTVVLLPDTQFYTGETRGGSRHIFYRQTDWVVENREALNIPFVLHMGDITESGDLISGVNNLAEWLIAINAMYRLNNADNTGLEEGIPYAVNVGNHDQEPIWRSSGTTTYFNRYFGIDHYSKFSYYGGHYGENNDNFFCLFRAGGYDFIVISLEYSDPARDPIDPNLFEWADSILKQYPGHRGIVVSHHMVNPGNPAVWSPYGEAIYEVLKDNPNLHLMFGGHVTGEGLRVNEYNGNTVYAMVQDYQAYPQGGSGYLRLLRFSPVENAIHFSTYSPWLDAYLDEFGGAFSLSYDLGTEIQPFEEVDRVEGVTNGSSVTFSWDGLNPSTPYDWFVVADDGRKVTTGPVARFHSAARTYSDWRAGFFTEGDLEGDREADPDDDNYTNYQEFVFSGNPKEPGRVEVALSSVILVSGDAQLSYVRLGGTGMEWTYEVSADMAGWIPAGLPLVNIQEQVTDQMDGTESVRLLLENLTDGQLFFRVRISDAN
ncbi:MAG: DNRLRE domain-containing protein [Puniceicoccaceae bacterium]